MKKDIIFIQGSFFDISSRCNILILTSAFEAFKITWFCNTSYYPISVLKSFILCLITKSGTKKLGLLLLFLKHGAINQSFMVVYKKRGVISEEECISTCELVHYLRIKLLMYIGIGLILAGRIIVSIICNVMDTYLLDIPSRWCFMNIFFCTINQWIDESLRSPNHKKCFNFSLEYL